MEVSADLYIIGLYSLGRILFYAPFYGWDFIGYFYNFAENDTLCVSPSSPNGAKV